MSNPAKPGAQSAPLLACALALACLSFGPAAAARPAPVGPAAPADLPNILFVILDDVGIDQMRTFGYKEDNQPLTPTIDTIAEAGVRFRNAWAMPECSPSRVSFFTGRYPLRTGVLNITLDNTLANSQMSPFEPTTPRILRSLGYKNGFFGKWHHTAFPSNNKETHAPNPGNPLGNGAPGAMGWDRFVGMLEGAPRGIDTSAGGVAEDGTYGCGFVTDASFGACYLTDGSCSVLGAPEDPESPVPGRACLESGGILVRNEACEDTVPANVQKGFEKFNGYYVAPLLINNEDGSIELVAGFDDHGNEKVPLDPRARRYLTQQQTDAAIDWIKAQQSSGNPWMATLSYSSAHLPAQQPPRALLPAGGVASGNLDCTSTLGQRAIYAEMIEAADRELARLLVETGLASAGPLGLEYRPDATDTMIVVVGDNGSYLQTVRLPFDPTRGKGTVYQTGLWVPLIVSGPLVDGANVGAEVPHMVNAAVDLYALFGEIAGVDVRQQVPPSVALDAQPMLPFLTNSGQASLRRSNFAQTGTVLQAPGVVPPCVLTIGGEQICTQIFTFEELCETEGGQWFGTYDSCCALQADMPDVAILPFSSAAIRNDRYKLVRNEVVDCSTNPQHYDEQFELYEIDQKAPLPKLDRADDNLLTSPTLPAQGLTPIQRAQFNKLLAELRVLLRSESACQGDGNLDKQVNQADVQNWEVFSDDCIENPNRCSSVYDFNLDGVTDAADLEIVEDNLNRRCPGFRRAAVRAR
jgi:arylsulfatase A-like enzyme